MASRFYGTPNEIRTRTGCILSALPLPVGLPEHFIICALNRIRTYDFLCVKQVL